MTDFLDMKEARQAVYTAKQTVQTLSEPDGWPGKLSKPVRQAVFTNCRKILDLFLEITKSRFWDFIAGPGNPAENP